jgi:hypothetical protein
MQLGILRMLLNSSAILSNSSDVGAAINIGCSIFPHAFYYTFSDSWRVSQSRKLFPTRNIPGTIFFQIPRNLRKRGEPSWLRLAQGLLLSPPSLYGDRLTIGYLWSGERAIRAFVFNLWSGNVTFCWVVFCSGLLAGLEEQPLVPPLELRRRPGYALVLNLVSFGDFEFSWDLCSFDIRDRLSSEVFWGRR